MCDLTGGAGSEQFGMRPVIVMQNDKGNDVSPVTTVIPLTSRQKHFVPTHVRIPADVLGTTLDSVALVEQIRVVDRSRLRKRLGKIKNADVLAKLGRKVRQNLEI